MDKATNGDLTTIRIQRTTMLMRLRQNTTIMTTKITTMITHTKMITHTPMLTTSSTVTMLITIKTSTPTAMPIITNMPPSTENT